jgi:hypothetical protein
MFIELQRNRTRPPPGGQSLLSAATSHDNIALLAEGMSTSREPINTPPRGANPQPGEAVDK